MGVVQEAECAGADGSSQGGDVRAEPTLETAWRLTR